MNLAFGSHIKSKFEFLLKSRILIAVSGGLDSVVLTHLCHNLKLDIALAHCNFNLRGNESDDDERFVTNLAETLDLEVFVESFDTKHYATQHKLSIQMAARELRYHWFYRLSEDLKFDYILTAHHVDDNLETVLINLTRGTGLSGLTGIPEVNETIVRPLLPFSRDDLESYAKANSYKWREDSTNASDKYLRNKLRHHVIPVLKEANPELLSNFKTTIENLNDASEMISDCIEAFTKRALVSVDETQLKFKISEFKTLKNPKTYLYELFHDYGFTQWDDVTNLLDAQSGKQIFSNTHRLLKDREHLILTEVSHSSLNKVSYNIQKEDAKVETPAGILFFDEADAIFGKRTNVVFVDKDKLTFPLTLRKWHEGDYFYPSGMTGKKKLSKYFKDEKLSLVDKENIWLLSSNDAIVWVLGMRNDDRFKVTQKTKTILKITLN
ncbi:tRNA lysidine(34) synthetase TilS [Psychroserpens algicola]|uniref:tRNA(Ile)-lysidine synthase n=1 Tax=Psychroserpens algicola TaxID=1719034 RepID=A0ABT0HBH5_9FLAO|nr:tRNA lysidine(34) synthetase TilS [Psychroserpens algicola]MCK8481192.1 tRNA lysidine(34) synthetase TilS [Psychroserpens algicola]